MAHTVLAGSWNSRPEMMDVVDEPITANSVLPARREPLSVTTADGLRLVGEVALPLENQPR
ncbi:MAG: hypothetical protein L7U42_01660, partial [Candidatus Nanopelagicales bacterium]|nr:hypothetical protein [Candidatus Nanopelagicales bacterium]